MAVEDISDYVAYTEHNHLANIVAALDQFDMEEALNLLIWQLAKKQNYTQIFGTTMRKREEIKDELLHDFEQMKRFYKQVLDANGERACIDLSS